MDSRSFAAFNQKLHKNYSCLSFQENAKEAAVTTGDFSITHLDEIVSCALNMIYYDT